MFMDQLLAHFASEVTFIPEQYDRDTVTAALGETCPPFLKVVKGIRCGHIIHDYTAVCAPVKGSADTLHLPAELPNL